MILLVVFALSVLAVPLTGGRLHRLASVKFRHGWLIAVALALQVVIVSLVPGPPDAFHLSLHVASYLFASAFLVVNRRMPGLWLVGAGAVMNLVAILANGGVMPASPSALATAGLPVDPGHFHNTLPMVSPRLLFLGDVFALPASWPFHNVFSAGDVAMTLGAALCVHRLAGSRLIPSGTGQFRPLLRRSRFMRLWTAQAVSNLGDWTYALAVAAILAQRTNSPGALSLLLVAQVGPAALAGVLLGPLADRHSRTALMVGADLARAAAVGSLFVAGSPGVVHIYLVAACLGVFGAVFQPSLQASIPNVVDPKHLVAANSMVSGTYYVSVMVGPALGGFLVAALGGRPVFAMNAASFLLSAVLLAKIHLPRPREAEAPVTARRDMVEGLRYAMGTPLVRGLLLVMAIVIVAAGTKSPLESLFVLGTLSLGPQALGLIAGSWGLGMLVGSVAAPALARRWARERLLWVSIGAVGCAVLFASRATELSPVLLAWALAGAANAIGDVAYDTLLQERTPDAVRGRVFAASGVVINSGFLTGAFLAGGLGASLGVRGAYAVAGALLLVAAVVCRAVVRSPAAIPPERTRPTVEVAASMERGQSVSA